VNAKQRPIIISLAAVAIIGGLVVQAILRQNREWKLSRAVSEGDFATVQRCVEAGVRIDATPTVAGGGLEGLPALTAASYSGHEHIVRYLLDHGANPNLRGMSNPLIVACWRRHPGVVRLLLDRGADPNVRGEGTPLYAAESTGQAELVALLHERGAHE
jgi:hypothetical protein